MFSVKDVCHFPTTQREKTQAHTDLGNTLRILGTKSVRFLPTEATQQTTDLFSYSLSLPNILYNIFILEIYKLLYYIFLIPTDRQERNGRLHPRIIFWKARRFGKREQKRTLLWLQHYWRDGTTTD